MSHAPPPRAATPLVALALLLAAGPASAAGISADIELIRPSFSPESLPGIDSPVIDDTGTLQAGVFLQYERDPLILYERQDEIGAVVARRNMLHIGATYDVGPRFSTRLVLPAALQWGTQVPELSREGAVLGDATVGVRANVMDAEWGELGLRGDLGLPTGTRDAWMGEGQFRGMLGGMGLAHVWDFDLLVDTGVVIRPDIPTPQDFQLGSELTFGAGLRYQAWRDRAAVSLGYLSRSGLNYLGTGGAENASELITALQVRQSPTVRWELGAGKGLSDGYGTTEFRAFAGVTWERPRPDRALPPELEITEIPPPAPVPVDVPPPDPPPEPEWGETELAKVEGEQIIIRDEIQFEVNTAHILPASLPTLRYAAGLLNDNWRIAHLVIEGHASEEGSDEYNYELSIERARAIWEELIRAGTHPDRMSYRGMGETVPIVSGDDEASLQQNRRVEFHIVRQYAEDEEPAVLRSNVLKPWSGTPVRVVTPVRPPPPEPEPEPDAENEDDFEEFLFESEEADAESAESNAPTTTVVVPVSPADSATTVTPTDAAPDATPTPADER